jgi:L-alanine-DL-glutamate epimerase-like enolase superfamily enzyme
MSPRPEARVQEVSVASYAVPTDQPESDGTLRWDSTALVVVHVSSGATSGLGFTYADASTAAVVHHLLADVVKGRDALDVPATWRAMVDAIRNQGRPGIASMAIAAVDVALWDLKAHLLDLPLVSLLGAARSALPVYGSGGFTSYDRDRLEQQLGDWAARGIPRVKM